ncbi:MAG: cysteine--tRNA ligase [Deltaproteobacteria bacterium]|nr:cysteine--tRNA ligase [Deltaproteobacteria bacterium]
MRLRLHDTMTGRLLPLVPQRPGEVRIYCCGPTVYDRGHVGHARAALAPDILVRHLRAQGARVTYVRNITDVDDKILKRAQDTGEPPMQLSARMAALYEQEMAALGCVRPDVEPKVSEHIEPIVALVERIVANGNGYAVELPGGATDVYFSVRSFPAYGKLSKRDIDELQVGARIERSEHKRDPLDFALWKGAAPEGWGWPSPWGRGRPGWHIECSAMSSKYLGHGFEVHCGGMDLIFPHHENEIAQSEAAFPGQGPFVQLWMHNGFVNVDKEKMAKSLGNFVTIEDVYARYDPEALRYFLLGVHYRGPVGFETEKLEGGRVVFPGIAEAERRVDYLYATSERLGELAARAEGEPPPAAAGTPPELGAAREAAARAPERLSEALDDDLNTPVGLAVVAELGRLGNELCDLAQKRRKDRRFVAAAAATAGELARALRRALDVLGLVQSEPAAYRQRTQSKRLGMLGLSAAQVEERLAQREQARQAKDFARADGIRAELAALGVELADSAQGTSWRVGVR